MLIKIHKIEKYKNYWKVRFTSERNENGIAIVTKVCKDYDELIKEIEKYIENNIPIIEEPNYEKDSSEIVIEEPEQPSEPTPEEIQLQNMIEELEQLVSQKEALSSEIKTLLEDWKLDLDLIKFKTNFNIEDADYDAIIQAKINRKLPKYIKLKTQYEELKVQIANKQNEIKEFANANNLHYP